MMRTLVVGDIHGAWRALQQCLERAGFSYQHDRLVVLGDVCDGFPEVNRCLDELLRVRSCVLILGNHDRWALEWAQEGKRPKIWTGQGGEETIRSYHGGPMSALHADFLRQGLLWFEDGEQLFVHGGFDPGRPIQEQDGEALMWDRSLVSRACEELAAGIETTYGPYRDIFVGHTPTQIFGFHEPMHCGNVWMVDTGAGHSGRLTIMDVLTKAFWQSDSAMELYGIQNGDDF